MKDVLISIVFVFMLNLPSPGPVWGNTDGQDDAVLLKQASYQIYAYERLHCQKLCGDEPKMAREYEECIASCTNEVSKMSYLIQHGYWEKVDGHILWKSDEDNSNEQSTIRDENIKLSKEEYLIVASIIAAILCFGAYFAYRMRKEVNPLYEGEVIDTKEYVKLYSDSFIIFTAIILFCIDIICVFLFEPRIIQPTMDIYKSLVLLAVFNGVVMFIILNQSSRVRTQKRKNSKKSK